MLLLLLLELVLGWRRLSMSALHSLSLGARFIRLSCCTTLRRDLLMKSGWTSPRSALFRRSHRSPRRRRAELQRLLRSLLAPLLRLLLLRWCTVES